MVHLLDSYLDLFPGSWFLPFSTLDIIDIWEVNQWRRKLFVYLFLLCIPASHLKINHSSVLVVAGSYALFRDGNGGECVSDNDTGDLGVRQVVIFSSGGSFFFCLTLPYPLLISWLNTL